MSQSGILILQPSKFELRQVYNLVNIATKYVQKVLYVDFNLNTHMPGETVVKKTFSSAEIYRLVREIYMARTKQVMDIRFLLQSETAMAVRRELSLPLEVALLHTSFQDVPGIVDIVSSSYNFKSFISNTLQFLNAKEESCSQEWSFQGHGEVNLPDELMTYGSVAVGGTFDRIHNGHRLLLTTSCLLCNSRIVVGISDEPLLVNKTLGELIEPLEVRMKNVEEFIDDIKPGLIKEIVPLVDPAGPTKTDPGLQCLVVSSETLKGGEVVNNLRKEAGLPEVNLFSIDLVKEDDKNCVSMNDESKISSTAGRKRDLGKLMRPVIRRPNSVHSSIYVIGLTGGIASGKSSIAKRLETLGAEIIDADELGHSVYERGTDAYEEIVKTFGIGILNSNKTVNRARLGAIVFSDREQMAVLNSIVWPKIAAKVEEIIADAEKKGCLVCVVEAALLLEAGWDKLVDEVWVSVVTPQEAVRRLKERNGLSEKEAGKRLASQMKSKERVLRANVVLSTLWEYEYTQKQVERAWDELLKRVNQEATAHL